MITYLLVFIAGIAYTVMGAYTLDDLRTLNAALTGLSG